MISNANNFKPLDKTAVRRSFFNEFKHPLDKVQRNWLRRLSLILLTPVSILLGMITGAFYLIIQLYDDCW